MDRKTKIWYVCLFATCAILILLAFGHDELGWFGHEKESYGQVTGIVKLVNVQGTRYMYGTRVSVVVRIMVTASTIPFIKNGKELVINPGNDDNVRGLMVGDEVTFSCWYLNKQQELGGCRYASSKLNSKSN